MVNAPEGNPQRSGERFYVVNATPPLSAAAVAAQGSPDAPEGEVLRGQRRPEHHPKSSSKDWLECFIRIGFVGFDLLAALQPN